MQLSALFVVAAFSTSAFAMPSPLAPPVVNLNEGGERLITDIGNGQFNVDPGLIFTDASLAGQVACAFDEKDCKATGRTDDVCTQKRLDCQSGNGINGATALLNKD